MRKLRLGILTAAVLMLLLAVGARAAEISDFYVTPAPESGSEGGDVAGEGTSNSIFTIHFNWHQEDDILPKANTLQLCVKVPYAVPEYSCYTLPSNAGKGNPSTDDGRLYEFRITAGQNLIVDGVTPPNTRVDHPIADLRDVFYIPVLIAGDNGNPNTITLYIRAVVTPKDDDPTDSEVPEDEEVGPETADVIIHDSHYMPSQDDPDTMDPISRNRYAGVAHDRDFLYAYEFYGDGIDNPKPLQTYALDENFRWRAPDDPSNGETDNGTTSTAWEFRVIYRNQDNLPPIPWRNSWGGNIGDYALGYRAGEIDSGVVLYIRNKSWDPTDDFVRLPMQKVNPDDNNYAGGVEYVYYVEPAWWNGYVGLPIGEYEWFVACSDDNVRNKTGGIANYLDPSPNAAVDLPIQWWTRNLEHDYAIIGDHTAYNTSQYLDRPTMQPGVTTAYDWAADTHPKVTVGLKGGQVTPRYMVVNPTNGAIVVGGAQNQKFDFQINYQHLYGVTPEQSQGAGGEISVWVNNSNVSVPDMSLGTNPATNPTLYHRYTLIRDATNPLGTNVKNGVRYHLPEQIQLLPGPHCYFFTASDGLKRARYPVDGHHWDYGDVFGGPYVNHKPVLENPMVDPPTGTAGDKFRYSVIYKDADNQRPYRARVYIEYATGQVYIGEMVKENPADNDYDGTGVKYIFDTANMAQQFQIGERRFYFEFIDDWGAPTDPRDQRQGETVYWQSAQPESWISGPYINRNMRPQLLDGSMTVTDGANNSATLFEYKVRYIDVDNHAPKYMDVFIGQKQADGTISWDYGHEMAQIDPADTVYNGDGAWFRYTTRLTGSLAGTDFYYCFSASDRYDVAEYDADPSSPTYSPSAGAVWMTWDVTDPLNPQPVHKGEELDLEGDNLFHTSHAPVVGPVPSSPTGNPYTGPKVWSTTGTQLGTTSVDYVNGLIGVANESTVDVQYLFATAGPTGVGTNNPPSLSNGRVSPDPGKSTDEYTYTVVYTDPDGTMGQPPYYIRVRIDGVAYDMARSTGQANPDYRQGVSYYYRTSLLSPALPHYYYFEASDGAGYAVYDKAGGRNVNIGAVTAIPGPYVNNLPTLTAPSGGTVNPVPGQPMNQGDPVNFSIMYTDANDEMPDAGFPVVYIRKTVTGQVPPITPPEPVNDFKVASVAGNVITAVKPDDSAPGWAVDEFKGLPIQITSSGPASMVTYQITGNTANTLTLFASTVPDIGAGTTFSIGKLILGIDTSDTGGAIDGVLYEYRLHNLGEGDYAVHFTSTTTERIGENNLTRSTTLRYPAAGEISGIKVVSTRLAGNQPPTLSNPAVAPPVGRVTDNFTFSVKYTDLDGDAPAYRSNDKVVGYVRLIIDGQAASPITMTGAGSTYVTGVIYSATVAAGTLAPGAHTCYFEASDGWLPVARTADVVFSVNRKPTLSEGAVTPTTGNAGMPYTFSVKVKDADNQRPPDGAVVLVLDGTEYPMGIDTSSGVDFVAGVRYTEEIHDPAIMTVGDHSFYFKANDGLEEADDMSGSPISGPTVYANSGPTLTVPMVDPVSRWTDSVYTYSVKYTDANGDAPEYVNVSIDGGTEVAMTRAAGTPDYTAGVTYTYQKQGLGAGSDHTYYFAASDHLDTVRSPVAGVHYGPTVGTKPGVTLVVNQPATPPAIGQAVTLTGSISPAMAVPVTLTFTRPDGTQFTMTANSVASTGAFSRSWTPDMTGAPPGQTWVVTASWTGNDSYLGGTSAETYITVTGPSATVRGLDMVSVPLDPANPFPGAVYGDGSYALAQYRPQRNDYAYYRSNGQYYSTDLPLSDITLGGGYWIKIYENQTKLVAPSGDLANSSANYTIHLYTGWNQIGCPFTTHVNWRNLRVKKGLETVDIYAAARKGWVRSYGWAFQQSASNPYTGEYKLVDPTRSGALQYMEPWHGYWFKALTECYLIVPPPSVGMQSQEMKLMGTDSAKAQPGWAVHLSAALDDKIDSDNSLGYTPGGAAIESPGYLENYIDLSFIGANAKSLAHDIRPAVTDGDSWDFKVATDQKDGLVEVAWSGIETLPAGMQLSLKDVTSGKTVQMTSGAVYTFPASEGGHSFRVTVGGK